jgi:steroid delta-isomerase-like uncharacterized protein
MNSTEIVRAFKDEVWNAHDPDAIDRFVVDDIVFVDGGQEITGKESLKNWIKELLGKVNGLEIDAIETFQNAEGSRVTSRFVLTGTNNGLFDTASRGQPIAMTGTAVWSVREDGKLTRIWYETSSWDQYRRLVGY